MFKRLGELLFNIVAFPFKAIKRLFTKRKEKKGIFPLEEVETIVKRLKNEDIDIVYELEDISIKVSHKRIIKEDKKKEVKKETQKEDKKKEVN